MKVLCICLKFSPVVWLKSLIKWQKNFGHSITCTSPASLFISKFWRRLTPRIVEIFSSKFFLGGFRPITVTSMQEFEMSWKNGVLKFFGTSDSYLYIVRINKSFVQNYTKSIPYTTTYVLIWIIAFNQEPLSNST